MIEIEDIVKSAPVYLLAKDKKHKFIYCNEKFAELLNVESPAQVIGKTDSHFFSKGLAKLYAQNDKLALQGTTLVNVPEIFQTQGGKLLQVLTSKSALKDAQGKTIGVVVSFIDITDKSFENSSQTIKWDQISERYVFNLNGKDNYFTQQQYKVFTYMAQGLTAKAIGEQLLLSPRTIEHHIASIKSKLQCKSKFHIIEAARKLSVK